MRDCRVGLPARGEESAQVVVHFSEVRPDVQRPFVVLDRRVDFVARRERVAEVVVGRGKAGIECERPAVLGDRRFELSPSASARPRLLCAST